MVTTSSFVYVQPSTHLVSDWDKDCEMKANSLTEQLHNTSNTSKLCRFMWNVQWVKLGEVIRQHVALLEESLSTHDFYYNLLNVDYKKGVGRSGESEKIIPLKC